MPEETRKKISTTKKGKSSSPETQFKNGQKAIHPFLKGNTINKGRKRPDITGPNAPWWKGGVSLRSDYASWIEKRRRARKLSNGGSHTILQWEEMKKEFDFTCPSCCKKEPDIKLTQDHVVPLVHGGSDDISNIQPLCGSCNSKKKTKTIRFNKVAIHSH